MCVQNLDDSRGLAIRITYRISLRSSSLWEPRHPLLKVVQTSIFIRSYGDSCSQTDQNYNTALMYCTVLYRTILHMFVHLPSSELTPFGFSYFQSSLVTNFFCFVRGGITDCIVPVSTYCPQTANTILILPATCNSSLGFCWYTQLVAKPSARGANVKDNAVTCNAVGIALVFQTN